MCGDPIWVLVYVTKALLPIQLPAFVLGKGGLPRALGPCTCLGDPEEALGYWFWIGAAPAIVATWGVNQWTEDLLLCLSSSLYI